jgi:hypothetical protein
MTATERSRKHRAKIKKDADPGVRAKYLEEKRKKAKEA